MARDIGCLALGGAAAGRLRRPEGWCKGIGSLALTEALGRIRTPLACATIRAGNVASLALFKKQGFRPAERFEKDNGKVVLMIRAIQITGAAHDEAPKKPPP